jgi:hypothetical protein
VYSALVEDWLNDQKCCCVVINLLVNASTRPEPACKAVWEAHKVRNVHGQFNFRKFEFDLRSYNSGKEWAIHPNEQALEPEEIVWSQSKNNGGYGRGNPKNWRKFLKRLAHSVGWGVRDRLFETGNTYIHNGFTHKTLQQLFLKFKMLLIKIFGVAVRSKKILETEGHLLGC